MNPKQSFVGGDEARNLNGTLTTLKGISLEDILTLNNVALLLALKKFDNDTRGGNPELYAQVVVSLFFRLVDDDEAKKYLWQFYDKFKGALTSDPIAAYGSVLHLLDTAKDKVLANRVRFDLRVAAVRKDCIIGTVRQGVHKQKPQLELTLGDVTYVMNRNQRGWRPKPGDLAYVNRQDSTELRRVAPGVYIATFYPITPDSARR